MKFPPKHPFFDINEFITQVSRKQKVGIHSESGTQPVDEVDTVKISQEARELQEAKKVLKKMPDVQLEKVAKLKSQINKGTYEIRSGIIAEKIIRESLLNELL